jgi:fido (protein-threonine AMPylation protein)
MKETINPVTGSKLKPWVPIEDLPANWEGMRHPELPVLAALWKERRSKMEDLDVVNEFHARLVRQWAIETGILERLYDIDRGTTIVLIERGIDATLIPHGASDRATSEVVSLLKDHVEVAEGLFQFVANKQALTNFYVRQLHQVLTRHQRTCSAIDTLGNAAEVELLRGEWKRLPNNPSREGVLVHEYCPPEHVQAEMDRLIHLHASHVKVDPVVEAAFLHHRFTQIHPFQDGNGRVARCLANIALLREELQPLVLTRDDRQSYISALEAADEGDLRPLVTLFALVEKRAFLQALSLSTGVIDRAAGLATIIKATAAKVRERTQASSQRRATLEAQTTERLMVQAKAVLQGVAEQFNAAFESTEFRALAVQQSDPAEANEYFFRSQIVDTAKKLAYFANMNSLRRWLRLTINDGFKTDILLSFHKVGHEPTELMGCSAIVSDQGNPYEHQYPAEPACEQPFLYTTGMNPEELASQYGQWLDHVMVVAMEIWRRKLGE